MTMTRPDMAVIEEAVELACHAPSIHNSQPWRWVADRAGVNLFVDADRLVSTDPSGREVLISCGAALDHLRVAMAGSGWVTHVARYPNPNDSHHLASVDFTPMHYVTDAHRRRADVILRRRTDRLPFGAPNDWPLVEALLRSAVDENVALLDVVSDAGRAELVRAAKLTESLRRYDQGYHFELDWWTGPFRTSEGVPHSSLLTSEENERVDIGRVFPLVTRGRRRAILHEDRSKVLVISAHDDTRGDMLACGEALSQVLLEATMADLATCTLTHLIEVEASRSVVASLVERDYPQILVRIGTAPVLDDVPTPTPRRFISEVLTIRQ